MNALETLQGAGLTVELLEGDRLRLSPKAALTEALRELAQAHKAEILARLREPSAEIAGEVEPSAPSAAPPTLAPVEAAPELAPTSADCWPALCFYGHIPRWQRPDGGWVCAVCHPPVNGELVVGLADESQAPPPELTEEPGWDPRPELTEDSTLWARLLALAYDRDGQEPNGLFGALLGMRCMGASLGVVGGKLKLTAGEMAGEEFGADCTKYLMPYRVALAELLRGLDVARHDMAQEKAA